MSTRSLVKAQVVRYMRERRITFARVRDIKEAIKARVPDGVDVYRIVYGLGMSDPAFRIEKDESDTYVVCA